MKVCRNVKWRKTSRKFTGGFHGSAHVSKLKYFCSLVINVFTKPTQMLFSSHML